MLTVDRDEIRVLHVDDEEQILSLTSLHLENTDDKISVTTETDVQTALDRIQHENFDCIVSDYNMPNSNGIEFLQNVRKAYPNLPFVLFTGRGSEEIASEAISEGVTDYLQKEVGTEQYTILANRIRNIVEQYRAVKEVEETREFYGRILDYSSDYVMIVDNEGTIKYISPAVERVMGFHPSELVGENSLKFAHPDDLEYATSALLEVITNPDSEVTVEFRSKDADGIWRWIEVRGRNLLEDPIIEGIMVNVRDVTERKEHEQNFEQQTERFQELTKFLSHDLHNQITIIDGRLELIENEISSDNVSIARESLSRIEDMIDKLAELAESGESKIDPQPVPLHSIIEQSWTNVNVAEATLNADISGEIIADPERLQTLFENLFLNAIEHGGPTVTVNVGRIQGDSPGFYVEDDGEGISHSDPETLFESGYTTENSGTGLGLAIVQRVSVSHDWQISIHADEMSGLRFEITDVEFV